MAGNHFSTTDDETLSGEAGADTFVFGPGHGNDVITNFANGEDRIDLRAFPIPGFADLTITSNDSGVTIDLTAFGGGTILLEGVSLDDLDTSDFMFPVVTYFHHGGSDDDFIHGTDGQSWLHGKEGDDTIYGHAGDDEIYGGAGDDTMYGGSGADTFGIQRNSGNDVIADFANGEDVIDLTQFSGITSFADLTVTSDDTGVTIDLTAHGGGTILLQGFDIDDLDAADFVFPTAGTAGDDTIAGDDGENWIYGLAGDDTIEGGDGRDSLFGGAGDDTMYGGAGSDNMYGGSGGVAYAYELWGESGNDTMYGGAGNDGFWGDDGDDTIYGGADNDSLFGGTGDDTLYGGEGKDLIRGGADNDALYGGDGDDRLYGDSGDDTLDGGAGDDTLTGGRGADTFVFAAGHGTDTIKDFTDGDDLIDLSAISGISGFEDLTITADGEDALIDLSAHGGGTIRLTDFSVDDLDEADFVFAEAPENAPPDRTNVVDPNGPVELGDITAHSGTGSLEGDVNGGSDVSDYFLFTLSESKTVTFVLASLEHDAGLEIQSEDGTVLFSSEQSGTTDERIEQTLEAGTYYVRVSAKEQGENDYVLNYSVESTDDTLTGGAGANTFAFDAESGDDTITDFSTTDGDRIDLTAFSASITWQQLSAVLSAVEDDPDTPETESGTVIDLSSFGGGTITLEGISSSHLTADMFILDDFAGGDGDDTIEGGTADDTLTGGEGADTFVFSPDHGFDTITDFTAGEDKIDLSAFTGITGIDDLICSQGGDDAFIYVVHDGGGTIKLEGVSVSELSSSDFTFYQDEYTGTDSAETLAGGGGDDTIAGLAGDDTLTGNEGADTFVFAANHGSDTITDFTDGEDSIDLTAITGVAAFDDLTITADGTTAVIDLSAHGGGTIRLDNVAVADLDAEDFNFYEQPVDSGVDGI